MIKCQIMDACEKNGFEGCCESCPDKDGCDLVCTDKSNTCGNATFEGTTLEVFQTKAMVIMNGIADVMKQKAAIEENEKAMRMQLVAAMEEHDITKVDHEILKINYIKPTTKTSIDSKKLKETYPHIYDECSKISNVKGYVKIELKKENKQ